MDVKQENMKSKLNICPDCGGTLTGYAITNDGAATVVSFTITCDGCGLEVDDIELLELWHKSRITPAEPELANACPTCHNTKYLGVVIVDGIVPCPKCNSGQAKTSQSG